MKFQRGDIVYISPATNDDPVAVELTGKRFCVEDWKRVANGDIFCVCSDIENMHKIVFRQCDLLKDTQEDILMQKDLKRLKDARNARDDTH